MEAQLERIADAKRRFRCATYEELLERAAAAAQELESLDGGGDPVAVAAEALAAAEARGGALAAELSEARRAAADPFAADVAAELEGVGLGDGEFRVELRERANGPGPAGADEAAFLIRPNAACPSPRWPRLRAAASSHESRSPSRP